MFYFLHSPLLPSLRAKRSNPIPLLPFLPKTKKPDRQRPTFLLRKNDQLRFSVRLFTCCSSPFFLIFSPTFFGPHPELHLMQLPGIVGVFDELVERKHKRIRLHAGRQDIHRINFPHHLVIKRINILADRLRRQRILSQIRFRTSKHLLAVARVDNFQPVNRLFQPECLQGSFDLRLLRIRNQPINQEGLLTIRFVLNPEILLPSERQSLSRFTSGLLGRTLLQRNFSKQIDKQPIPLTI